MPTGLHDNGAMLGTTRQRGVAKLGSLSILPKAKSGAAVSGFRMDAPDHVHRSCCRRCPPETAALQTERR